MGVSMMSVEKARGGRVRAATTSKNARLARHVSSGSYPAGLPLSATASAYATPKLATASCTPLLTRLASLDTQKNEHNFVLPKM